MGGAGIEHRDVVIAGAAPAGAQCARDLAARGHDALVLEAETEAAFPAASDKSTGGTFPPMLSTFGIPDEIVENYTDHVVFESPNEHNVHRYPGAVLDFTAFKRFLVRDGRDRGTTYRFDARVRDPLVRDGEVVGVQYGDGREVRASIVVDATGPAARLARSLGVSRLPRVDLAVGVEYEMSGVSLDEPGYPDLTDSMLLRLDHDVAPGGYAWIFHAGGDAAKVGVCVVRNRAHRRHASDELTIDDRLARWIDTDPRLATAERTAGQHRRGSAHVRMPGGLSTGGFLAVGDTVPTVDPVWGEGIRWCLRSGRAAAATADRCLIGNERDTSAESMALYDELWHREVAPRRGVRDVVSRVLYHASNERFDTFVRDLRRPGAREAPARRGRPASRAGPVGTGPRGHPRTTGALRVNVPPQALAPRPYAPGGTVVPRLRIVQFGRRYSDAVSTTVADRARSSRRTP
jgi:digeranylgeranylglycerophospholipid reductase